jgi:hypothetical protein
LNAIQEMSVYSLDEIRAFPRTPQKHYFAVITSNQLCIDLNDLISPMDFKKAAKWFTQLLRRYSQPRHVWEPRTLPYLHVSAGADTCGVRRSQMRRIKSHL